MVSGYVDGDGMGDLDRLTGIRRFILGDDRIEDLVQKILVHFDYRPNSMTGMSMAEGLSLKWV